MIVTGLDLTVKGIYIDWNMSYAVTVRSLNPTQTNTILILSSISNDHFVLTLRGMLPTGPLNQIIVYHLARLPERTESLTLLERDILADLHAVRTVEAKVVTEDVFLAALCGE